MKSGEEPAQARYKQGPPVVVDCILGKAKEDKDWNTRKNADVRDVQKSEPKIFGRHEQYGVPGVRRCMAMDGMIVKRQNRAHIEYVQHG
jgi:hypothetical protein